MITEIVASEQQGKASEILCDLAGEFPRYIYLSPGCDYLLHSDSLTQLLQHPSVQGTLDITGSGISFLLQNGVIPPPHTVYRDIYIVGIGDRVRVIAKNGKLQLHFSHTFPFLCKNRPAEGEPDDDYLLETIAEAALSKIDAKRETYLFHSAGKDSNTIALAIAEAGKQENITCITHQSRGDKDESAVSRKIAGRLGFRHKTIPELKSLTKTQVQSIYHYFEEIPLPSTDNVTLAYPIYATQFDFRNKNIIDGSGNDVYMGYIPDRTNYLRTKRFSPLHRLRPLTGKLPSTSWPTTITRTRPEWSGMFGFSYGDTRKIYSSAEDVYPYWREEDRKRADWDYFDLRSDIRGSIIEPGIFQLKVRLSASVYDNNLILPFTSEKVATYLYNLPEHYLFDRKRFKNKLLLRRLLKDRIGLDSDRLGKMAYVFDFYTILSFMKESVDREIVTCGLWEQKAVKRLLARLYSKIANNPVRAEKYTLLLQRLYLISIWYNVNRYVKRV